MDEKVTAALSELLQYVKATADFAAAQAPLVAQEIVRWAIADAIVTLIACAAVFYAGRKYMLWLTPKFSEERKKNILKQDEGLMIGGFLSYVGAVGVGIALFLVSVNAASQLVKAIAAPRLVVLERIADMVGSK